MKMREEERAQTEACDSEQRYRVLWDHAVDAKLLVDAGGTVLDANRRSEAKLGRKREELLGMQAAALFAPSVRGRYQAVFERVRIGGEEATAAELTVPIREGGALTMDLHVVPIASEDGWQAVLQLNDVSEKASLARQLLRSERLAALSQFASMFAHDIRNPLAGMKKTLEVLASHDGVKDEVALRLVDDLQFTTELLLGMVNDMLDVYQDSYSELPLVRSSFPARDLLQDVARLLKCEADSKEVRVRVQVPPQAMVVAGDRRRLQRVLINLLHNALKFAPARSVVSLSAARQEEELRFHVEDEGPGVDPDEIPHLFELFFRKKTSGDPRVGRGLGLHFCRLVAEAHGGRIWVENRSNGGARFSLALPVVPPAASAGQETS